MTWYYWVLTCWIGLNMLMIPWFWALGLLVSKRAGCNSIRPIRAPSPVLTRMGGEKMFEERRKSKRFESKDGAFAAFIRPNHPMDVGQIQDIGMGIQCPWYLSTNGDHKGCSEIKIFSRNDRFIHLVLRAVRKLNKTAGPEVDHDGAGTSRLRLISPPMRRWW